MIAMKKIWTLFAMCALLQGPVQATIIYLDSNSGKDSNSGTSEATPWKSLAKANAFEFKAGDSLRLKRGAHFEGGLSLSLNGTAEQPVVIEAYGIGAEPVIDAKGYVAGVHLKGSHYVVVRDLEITADGGMTISGKKTERYGVFVQGSYGSTSHVTLENLSIYKIYPELGAGHEGQNATTFIGTGISIQGSKEEPCTDFVVQNCRIAQTGFKAIDLKNIQHVQVLNNHMKDIGGPAIQPGTVDDLVVRGNTVDGSGSDMDPRMHMRGSGIWPWGCNRVLIEKNTFMHARGKADSCGIHIDFNCRDVIVQYNLSIDNVGGFVEILGNNHNCAYRYNISINDGARKKGDRGAHQEGKILWTSGYVGSKKEKKGPYNSYIYNNTIYVGPNSRSCFSISSTTEGLLIANNIFHILGKTENVLGDQDARIDKTAASITRSRMQNNVYYKATVLPENMPLKEQNMIVGDPRFQKAGGLDPKDYIPRNTALIKDRGIVIPLIEGDTIGLSAGLDVAGDFFGNPIIGKPDIGAIELSR
jgi:hypothetical protein